MTSKKETIINMKKCIEDLKITDLHWMKKSQRLMGELECVTCGINYQHKDTIRRINIKIAQNNFLKEDIENLINILENDLVYDSE